MRAGQTKEGGKLTGQFAEELKILVKGYLLSGAFHGEIADHLEGMANRVRFVATQKEGEF